MIKGGDRNRKVEREEEDKTYGVRLRLQNQVKEINLPLFWISSLSFFGSSYPTMGQKLNFCHFRVCPFLCGTASEFPRMRSVCRMRCCPLSTSTLPSADSPRHTWRRGCRPLYLLLRDCRAPVLQPWNYAGPWHPWVLAMALDSPQREV